MNMTIVHAKKPRRRPTPKPADEPAADQKPAPTPTRIVKRPRRPPPPEPTGEIPEHIWEFFRRMGIKTPDEP
jgi:hypothetical protein